MKTAMSRRRAASAGGFALALVLASGGAAWAQYRISPRTAMSMASRQQGQRNGMNRQGNGQVIAELRQIERKLAQADADYDGHRGRAMQEIAKAIRDLEPAAMRRMQGNAGSGRGGAGNLGGAGNGSGVGNRGGQGGRNRMPQANSDAQLRQALQGLSMVENQLANFGNSPQHARALAQLRGASQQLQLALKIR